MAVGLSQGKCVNLIMSKVRVEKFITESYGTFGMSREHLCCLALNTNDYILYRSAQSAQMDGQLGVLNIYIYKYICTNIYLTLPSAIYCILLFCIQFKSLQIIFQNSGK